MLEISLLWPFSDLLTVPPELAALQGLTRVSLHGFCNPLPLLSSLPNLRVVSTGVNVSEDDAMSFPPHLGHLTRLTSLELDSLVFDSSFHRLSDLQCLKELGYSRNDLVPVSFFVNDCSAGGLFSAMHSLRSLQAVEIHAAGTSIDMAVLSALVALTAFSLSQMSLPTFVNLRIWQHLQKLCLHSNKLLGPPSGLQGLTALTVLELCDQSRFFRFTKPLTFIQSMPALQLLDLRQNRKRESFGLTSPPHAWTSESKKFLAHAESCILPSLTHAVKFQY